MQPVSLATIHHEGAGNPVDWARGGEGGYSIWVGDVNGDGAHVMLRTPWESWGTFHFNHVSLDICLSGDRDVNAVTDADILTIAKAVGEARALGWVVDHPLVRQHHDSPGSSTVCPGTLTRDLATWMRIVQACNAPTPTTGGGGPIAVPIITKVVKPMYQPAITMKPWTAAWLDAKGHVIAAVADNGDVYAFGCPFRPWKNQAVDFAGRHAVSIGQAPGLPAGRYIIGDSAGEHYCP